MKALLFVVLLNLFLVINIQWVSAQQNLFNVSSSDLTLKGEPFLQQQINFTHQEAQLNTTFDWGLGKRTEIGFNVISLNINTTGKGTLVNSNHDKSSPPVYPLYTLNFQKAWLINSHFKIGLGTQTGFSNKANLADFTYCNLVTALPKSHTKIITGLYYGTDTFLGTERRSPFNNSFNPIGIEAGIEEQLIPEKFSIIIEAITGKHSLSETSAGLAYFLSPNWILSSAYLFANSHSTNQNALVMELTYCPSSKVHLKLYKHGHQPRTTA